jgi:ADP-heptose:LPS heptosyltransferase
LTRFLLVKRGRILVIRGGAIGDFILTLPALAALRDRFPEAHIEVLGYPHIAQLALAGGVVDRVHPIESRGLAGFFAEGGSLDWATAGYFAGFDLIVSYLFDPDDIFKSNVALCSRAQFIQGPHRPNEAERLHATQVYLKPLERLAIFDADATPRLRLPVGAPHPQPLLAIHPGSGSPSKNWPELNWSELLLRLVTETSAGVLLVGGEAEGDRLERLAAALPPERVQVARSLPLVELAGQLQRCALFLGHDSGITHLAAALGLPAIVLWAHTIPEIWRPQGRHVVLVQTETGLAGLGVDRVFREVQAVFQAS